MRFFRDLVLLLEQFDLLGMFLPVDEGLHFLFQLLIFLEQLVQLFLALFEQAEVLFGPG